jgi:hypothetical protein
MGGHLEPNSQMELVGHSIVRFLFLCLSSVHVSTCLSSAHSTCTFVSTHSCLPLAAKCLLDFALPGSNFYAPRILSSLTFSGFDFTSIYRSTVWRDVCFLWSTSYGMNFMVLYLCYKFKNRKTVNHIWHASRLNLILDTMFASELHLAYFMVPSLCLLLILDVLSHY